MSKPNPCPFCGKKSETKIEVDEHVLFPDEIYLVISRCCDGKTWRFHIGSAGSDLENLQASIEAAVNKWNAG